MPEWILFDLRDFVLDMNVMEIVLQSAQGPAARRSLESGFNLSVVSGVIVTILYVNIMSHKNSHHPVTTLALCDLDLTEQGPNMVTHN